ncbi:DUF952 domain-containing protein [Streptomyces sp. ISL-12]|uniref:DUF952 domain-containing protein n=1 Tax=Streptomyces sp. ISL-12 TaxID=2819177 RepID=UPI001BE6ACC8|nr:DUF952 domain-containing protein [Streptomyces sp. ISL-12]MBT2413244.1 DUF952 domain-containing protein [Streptomyces sp. ISL-12]
MLYHAASLEAWLTDPHLPYSSATLRVDGSVHCSVSEDALLAAVAHIPRKGPLLALVIDEARLDPPVTWATGAGGAPVARVRGPVNRDAVVALMEIAMDGDGRATGLGPPKRASPGREDHP